MKGHGELIRREDYDPTEEWAAGLLTKAELAYSILRGWKRQYRIWYLAWWGRVEYGKLGFMTYLSCFYVHPPKRFTKLIDAMEYVEANGNPEERHW